ncbi:MAG: hypothetical protein V4638_10700 [Bacteroidota bacterium]
MRILFLLVPLSILLSCSQATKKETLTSKITLEDSVGFHADINFDTLVGQFAGEFGGSPIQINLTHVTSKHATGYNIHKGLVRNMSGKVSVSNGQVSMRLEEPGDHEFDGAFDLVFNEVDLSLKGNWTPLNGKLSSKKIQLTKLPDLKFEEGKITRITISSYFNFAQDSLGSYSFNDDGLVTFEYYPSQDQENHIDQMETIKGTWSLKNTTVKVNWENNSFFASREMSYEAINTSTEYEDYRLVGKNSTIYPFEP